MTFSIGDFCIVSFSSSEMCKNRYSENRYSENQYSENRTLLVGANKNWPYILHFSSDLYKFRTGLRILKVSFVKIVGLENILYLEAKKNF